MPQLYFYDSGGPVNIGHRHLKPFELQACPIALVRFHGRLILYSYIILAGGCYFKKSVKLSLIKTTARG